MCPFLRLFGLEKLMALQRQLRLHILLLLLQLDHAVRFIQFLLPSEFCSHDSLLLLLQGGGFRGLNGWRGHAGSD